MHDCKGRPITEGDIVLVPFKVVATQATEEFCNVSLETIATMFPGTSKSFLTANTKQVIRANEGDDTRFDVIEDPSGAVSIL